MSNKRKKVGRDRPFTTEGFYRKDRVVSPVRESVERCIPKPTEAEAEKGLTVKQSRVQYLNDTIQELDKLIEKTAPPKLPTGPPPKLSKGGVIQTLAMVNTIIDNKLIDAVRKLK